MSASAKVENGSAIAFVAPFAVFMVLLEVIGRFRIENAELPWWRQFPEQWGYPLQAIVCLVLIWLWRKCYPAINKRGMGLAVVAGIVGICLWLLPPLLHYWTGIGGADSWLSKFGFTERLEGFDPKALGEKAWIVLLVVSMRFLRLVVVVPLVEEIFWRGFLMRWLSQGGVDWQSLPLEKCKTFSLYITAAAFALAHAGPDMLVAFFYGLLAGWVTLRTGNLWAVVVMHATANLCLGIFILMTGWWGLW